MELKTEKEIRSRLKKRIAQAEGKVFMGWRVRNENIEARIEELMWVLGIKRKEAKKDE